MKCGVTNKQITHKIFVDRLKSPWTQFSRFIFIISLRCCQSYAKQSICIKCYNSHFFCVVFFISSYFSYFFVIVVSCHSSLCLWSFFYIHMSEKNRFHHRDLCDLRVCFLIIPCSIFNTLYYMHEHKKHNVKISFYDLFLLSLIIFFPFSIIPHHYDFRTLVWSAFKVFLEFNFKDSSIGSNFHSG